jgi:excisionase family DNA binding protein
MKSELVNCKTLASELKVNDQFLRKLVREKKIPFYRLSERTLRFDVTEVKNYMRLIAEGKPTVKRV